MIKETASAALMKNGINVYNLETVPAPVVFREARKYGAGLVITSSHNPLEWNGIKFIINGRRINESELPKIIENQVILKSKIGIEEKITSSYIEDAKKLIGNIENQPNVVVDIGGGAAKEFAPNLLRQLGCKVDVINENIDNCTRGPDPTADNLSDLITASKKGIGSASAPRCVARRSASRHAEERTRGDAPRFPCGVADSASRTREIGERPLLMVQ